LPVLDFFAQTLLLMMIELLDGISRCADMHDRLGKAHIHGRLVDKPSSIAIIFCISTVWIVLLKI